MIKPVISKLIPAVCMIVLSSAVAFSQSPERDSLSEGTLKKPVYEETSKARGLAARSLARSGRANMIIDESRDIGAVHVVKVVDRVNKNALRNELVIRKDGAIMPVYGAKVNGRPTKERIDNIDFARRLSAIWLWRTGQKTLQVGSTQETGLAYVVDLHPKEQLTVLANQLIIRKDGFILPVGNGKTAMMLCIGCGGPGGGSGSFGWENDMMLPLFPTDLWGWSEGWGNDWDSGWWGSGWGWGWGSSDSWTPPSNEGNDDCEGMTPGQCFCLRKCRDECRDADPDSKCFENCVDICGLTS